MVHWKAQSFLWITSIALYPSGAIAGAVQVPGLTVPSNYQMYTDNVRDLFSTSYLAYKQKAYGSDDLLPVSEKPQNDRNGWGATIFDSLSTMYIMGLNSNLSNALDFALKVDFTQTSTSVSLFETTIRYLGGMMSLLDLCSINADPPACSNVTVLVAQAKTLGDKLAYAWSESNVIPYGFIDFSSNTPLFQTSNIAEAGSLALEWATLSKYTNDEKYGDYAIDALRHIATLKAPLPGLAGQGINPSSGTFTNSYVSWGASSDSYFEYLIKYARLSNTDDSTFADTWKTAVDSSIRTLMKTSTVGSHVYLADYDDNKQIRHVGSHLACFYGGNWILGKSNHCFACYPEDKTSEPCLAGGKLTNNDTIVKYGLELTDGCWNTYASTQTGIGPETFAFESSDGNFTASSGPSSQEQTFYNAHGYYITDGNYNMRPEVIEANFYAWRATGNTTYLDRAVSFYNSIQKWLPVTAPGYAAYAGLVDVNNSGAGMVDTMPSFWFAEVLKYLYLTFEDPSRISLDEYVFNTEAHPLAAPPAKAVY